MRKPRIITLTNLAGPRMSAVTLFVTGAHRDHARPRPCTRLPSVPVDDLVERPPVRPDNGS